MWESHKPRATLRIVSCLLSVVARLHMLHNVRHHLVSYFIVSFNEQWGRTPLLIAVLRGHADVARFLLENGSDVHEQTNVSMVEQSYVFVHVVYCSC